MSSQALALPGPTQNREAIRLDHKLTSVRRYVIAGILTVFGLVGGIGGWAATTDLAGAVVASGTVVVASNVKKVQHPTGGVVGHIYVKNGDKVKAGDLLVRLDETVTRANLAVITRQLDELIGRRSRLRAERDDAKSIAFPPELVSRAGDPEVDQILAGEKKLFESRNNSDASKKKQLDERISAMKEEISGLVSQAESKTKEVEYIAKELTGLETLEAKQLVTTTKIMALRRDGARIDGERAQLKAAAASSRGKIAEIEVQKLGLDQESTSETMKDLRESEGKIAELSERRTAAEDQLRRIDLKAPVDGTVHQLTVFTVGGVINTAEPLMLIVPEGDKLVIEAKIAPQDIDQARSHEEAMIRFPAFNQRTTPQIQGRVANIAADLTKEQQQPNIAYYVARVEISDEEMKKLANLKLVPGMPAEVQIKTTSRTALSYLLKPLQDQFAKAFKER
jgi:HlyD family secretion protein